ncbi:hypothetical protein ACCT30_37065, partial [Rhizobium ruizarguesonis]
MGGRRSIRFFISLATAGRWLTTISVLPASSFIAENTRISVSSSSALASRPQILLLDEATSALDEETEMRVFSAMKED